MDNPESLKVPEFTLVLSNICANKPPSLLKSNEYNPLLPLKKNQVPKPKTKPLSPNFAQDGVSVGAALSDFILAFLPWALCRVTRVAITGFNLQVGV